MANRGRPRRETTVVNRARVTAELIQRKRAGLDILERVYRCLDDMEKDYSMKYDCVGKETEQAKDWRTGELKWEDDEHTIPYYNSKWDYVLIPEDELTEDQKQHLVVINSLRDILNEYI